MTPAVAQSACLDAALSYAARGWPVLPCRPRDKIPATPHGCHDATTDAGQIERWWAAAEPEANVAIATGALIVVDVDRKNGGDVESLGELPATARVNTPGGIHLYFLAPAGVRLGNSAGKLAPGIDTRGHGGYVVAPPSVHRSGELYEWEGGRPADLAYLPDRLAAQLAEPRREASPAENGNGPLIADGNRNAELTRMAGRLRRDGLSAKAIEGAILQVNAERCSPPLDAAEVAKIARSVGRYPPATRPANPYRPATPYVAFPVGLLPSALAGFVAQTADAMGCDPAMVALPAMASAAAAIGTTRKVALKDSWHEPPIVWTCIVARSGSLKTPAFEAATRPMRDAQIESLREHREAAVAYERDLLEYERSLARWKKGKGDELPEKPEAPAATRSSSATPRLRRCRRSCRRIPAAC